MQEEVSVSAKLPLASPKEFPHYRIHLIISNNITVVPLVQSITIVSSGSMSKNKINIENEASIEDNLEVS